MKVVMVMWGIAATWGLLSSVYNIIDSLSHLWQVGGFLSILHQ
jgi:hypothetical protein